MSEYWKSTPKYWCKHCKTYVRDTKLEKQQHEATPKHQGNLKRFLRDLHRGHERDERDKDRAKQEVERLNGVISGTSSTSVDGSSGTGLKRKGVMSTAPAVQKEATAEDRKKQLAQLADMGVALPDEFRGDLAMSGEWQTVSQTPIWTTKKEDEDEMKEPASVGVRKRKLADKGDVEDEAEETDRRRGWGSTIKTYPGSKQDGDELDALLNGDESHVRTGVAKDRIDSDQRLEGTDGAQTTATDATDASTTESTLQVKQEYPDDPPKQLQTGEPELAGGERVIFKKRKAKPIRQK